MFFLLHGLDSYRSQKKLASLRAKFKADRDPSGLNEQVMRADRDSLEMVAEALHASPFLAERKLVVLEGFLGANKELQEKIADILVGKPDSTVAILYHDDAASKASVLYKLLKDQKFTEEFCALDNNQLIGFIAAECAEVGVQIDVRACHELASAVGADSWALRQEAHKLCAYAQSHDKKMVTVPMVREMIETAVEDSVFAFLDACTQGRTRDAVNLLEKMVSAGTNELQILAMLHRQLRSMIGVKDLLQRGVGDKNEIARQLGIHPYPAGKAMTNVRNLPIDGLEKMLGELVEMERRFKTGQGKLKAEIGLFAAEMAKIKA